MTIYSFTGTREKPTPDQLRWLDWYLHSHYPTAPLHHGCCVGADAVAHRLAILYGYLIELHPPTNLRYIDSEAIERAANSEVVTVHPPKPYHERNRDIVDACNVLIAMPNGPQRPHSGTWYTIGYASDQGKPILVCYPDGRVQHRGKWGLDVSDLD